MAELLKPQPALDLAAVSPGGWLRAPAETNDEEVDLSILGPDAEDDGFERMARQVARTYATEDTDDEDLEDFFDDDDEEEETEEQPQAEVLPISLAAD